MKHELIKLQRYGTILLDTKYFYFLSGIFVYPKTLEMNYCWTVAYGKNKGHYFQGNALGTNIYFN